MGAVLQLQKMRDDLRRDLAGLYRDVAIVRAHIKAVERCLSVFGGEAMPPAKLPKPARYQLFAQGEISRTIADIRRTMPELTDHRQIAKEFMRRKSLDLNDIKLWARLTQSVRTLQKKRYHVT